MKEKMTEPSWSTLLPKLLDQLEKNYKEAHYPLLLAHLALSVKILSHPNVSVLLSFLKSFLPRFEVFCVTLDDKAREFEFRNYLSKHFVKKLYQGLQSKLTEEEKATLSFETFFDDLSHEKLVDSQQGQVHYPRFYEQEQWGFKHFLNADENQRFEELKKKHTQRTQALANQVERNQFITLSEPILAYWKTLVRQSPNVLEKADKRPLLELGEGLWAAFLSNPAKYASLWRVLLVLQSLLLEMPWDEDSEKALHARRRSAFRLAIHIQLTVHRVGSNTSEADLFSQVSHLLDPAQSSLRLPMLEACQLFDFEHRKESLAQSRRYFQENISVLETQKKHTADTLSLLKDMVSTAQYFMGIPAAAMAFCVLGSTSRSDRRPYSDLECMVLYEPLETYPREWVEVYVFQVIALLEMQVIALGETNNEKNPNAGFHLDSSSHIFAKKLWGTPEVLAYKFVTGLVENWDDWETKGHPWICDESFYSLLQPVLVPVDSKMPTAVFETYQNCIQSFLLADLTESDSVDVLQKETGLPLADFKKRYQVIAWACLQDVIKKSIENLQRLKAGDKVDIKQTYYKPLAYLALNLRLFYNREKAHPSESLILIRQGWAGDFVKTLLTQTLAFITQQQVNLHLSKKHQEEEMDYLSGLSTKEGRQWWVGVDLLTKGLFLPLNEIIHQQKSIDFMTLGYRLLRSYLDARENWFNHWKSKGINLHDLLSHPLIKSFSTVPSSYGWSPSYESVMQAHLAKLVGLTNPQPSACRIEGLPTGNKPVYLPEALVKDWFDTKGNFQGNPAYSGRDSHVRRVEWQHQVFYVKTKPGNAEGLMGREFAVQTLHLLLGGECQVALGWGVKLTYAHKGIEKITYAWISQAVGGEPLAKVMRQSPQKLSQKGLDQESYSQHVLLAYLTCPEDGQPENFVMQSVSNNKNLLKGIDMGHSFVSTQRLEKDKPVMVVKTIVYLLASMEQPLDEGVITRCKLLDTEAFFKYWQAQLHQFNRLFKPLLEKELKKTKILQAEWFKYNQIIDLPENTLICVQQRFKVLQTFLINAAPMITGWQLLERLDPLVAFSYRSLKGKVKTPEDFYKIDPKAYIKDPKTGKMYSSTTFKQIQTQTLTPEQLQQSFQLTGDYFETINFYDIQSESQQQFLLDLLYATARSAGPSFKELNLAGCNILTETFLIELLKYMPRLKRLDIQECTLLIPHETLFNLLGYRCNEEGFFLQSYEVLCPMLNEIVIEINQKKEIIFIRLSALERKNLIGKIKTHKNNYKKVMDILLKALENEYSYVRRAAAEALGGLGQAAPIVINALMKVLKDRDDNVRRTAAKALAKLGRATPAVIDLMFEALEDRDSDVRQSAEEALGKLGQATPAVIEKLVKALESKYSVVSQAAAQALARLNQATPAVIDLLIKALGNEYSYIRQAAVEALGKLSQTTPAVIDSLLRVLEDKDNYYIRHRQAAAEVLGRLGQAAPVVIDTLVKTLGDENKYVSLAVAQALVRLNQATSVAIDILLKALEEENKHVSLAAAVQALINLDQEMPGMTNALIKALGDKELSIRRAAAVTLVRLDQVTPAVTGTLERSGYQVAVEDLVRLDQAKLAVIDTLIKALRDKSSWSTRQAAVEGEGRLEQQATHVVIDTLLEALRNNENSDVRQAAAQMLGKLGQATPAVIDTLVKILGDKNRYVCQSVAEALGKLGETPLAVIDILIKASEEWFSEVHQIAAVQALGGLGQATPAVIDTLVKVLAFRNNSRDVRQAAAQALVKLNQATPTVIDILLKISGLGYWDNTVRQAAAQALGSLFSVENSLKKLREWLVNKNYKLVEAIKLPRAIRSKFLFFISEDEKSLLAMGCVSKDWNRWQKDYIESMERERHEHLLGKRELVMKEKLLDFEGKKDNYKDERKESKEIVNFSNKK